MKQRLMFVFTVIISQAVCFAQNKKGSIAWGQTVTISNEPTPANADSTWGYHQRYGSQYARLLQLKNGSWLAGYTVAPNKGYQKQTEGGLQLQISQSMDNGKHWTVLSSLKDEGRDLDNAQLIQLKDGSVLLACRSVRWQESYRLQVYKSTDGGKIWRYQSTIDANEGKAGELGKPDKGIYEPHFYVLDDGRLSVMYANEKHVTETPSYSQIISQKISDDKGKTWGKEIWVAYEEGHNASRPGMPVWTKMKNENYIVVYEVCGPEKCAIYNKKSKDGIHWERGLGKPVKDQLGAPFILSLSNGDLIVTSNSSNISMSSDYGAHWQTVNKAFQQSLWPALYQFNNNTIGVVSAEKRPEGGTEVQVQFGIVQ
ncbi:MAG: glycoside hydrolase [Bacteroidota bacterium]|nr:glycoside hydrolase [Bacteroidota bacterium]